VKVADFSYQLPEELIAQYPPEKRGDSRLLKLRRNGEIDDGKLVLNNTKVVPARVFGQKDTGGRIEILLERVSGPHRFLAQIKASKAPKVGQTLKVDEDDSVTLTVTGRQESFFEVSVDQLGDLYEWFEEVGHMPLPPYIDRADAVLDIERYQTVFAQRQGAVAAPTAGLHYDQTLLTQIKAKGIQIAYVTLHVGAGTYQPVRVDRVDQHIMHSESIKVSAAVCEQVIETKARGGRVVAYFYLPWL